MCALRLTSAGGAVAGHLNARFGRYRQGESNRLPLTAALADRNP